MKIFNSQKGASLLETALILPILLLGIFVIVWVGVTFSARSSFEASLENAIRLATRGDRNLMRQRILPEVQVFKQGGAFNGRIQSLLSRNVLARDAEQYLDRTVSQVFGRQVRNLPEEYLYSLIYLQESLANSIGSTVQFPCDASQTPGCVGCIFLNPRTLDTTAWNQSVIPRRTVALQCQYQPSNFLLNPILSLLSGVTGGGQSLQILIQRNRIIDWETAERRNI